MLLSVQLLTDLTFKSTIARIYYPNPPWPAGTAAAAGAVHSDPPETAFRADHSWLFRPRIPIRVMLADPIAS